ncbi:uncharacterized protein LOC110029315 [Phalaenopsis equestris]|uniref:uncharacterized protein LOC110029315 n=1 Tax=Phalaenopsis equestris TaxID=78828 RepID=UPI0009E47518|nr:uncharacterized protein LOC110029315 [Phalaenopsis equestris]
MASSIDISTDYQWTKATYTGVVGKSTDSLHDYGLLVFPQDCHDTAAVKGSSPCIHPLGSKEGETTIYFTTKEIDALREEVKFTLVGKFQLGHPKMEQVRSFFESLKFIVMKIIKWTPGFDPSNEPPVVPLWFKLPSLPLPYIKLNALFNIGRALGTPLRVDAPTYNKARPGLARIQVERDITLPELKRIWIGSDAEGFGQDIIAKQKPPYYCPLLLSTLQDVWS